MSLKDLLFNCETIYKDEFNIDLDGYNRKELKEILKRLRNLPIIINVTVYKNKFKYKHYHIFVNLKPHGLRMWKIIMLRLFFNDHPERIRKDLDRLNINEFETFDYIGNKKFELNLTTNKLKKVAEYEETRL